MLRDIAFVPDPTSDPSQRPLVVLGFCSNDVIWKRRLVRQLRILEGRGVIRLWEKNLIEAGKERPQAIRRHFSVAEVAIVLVSAEFLISEEILEYELPLLLQRREEGLRLVPLLVEPCAWQGESWLEDLEIRPRDREPLSLKSKARADREMADLVREVGSFFEPEALSAEKEAGEGPGAQEKARVQILIDMEFEEFSKRYENLLRHGLADFLKIAPQDVRILSAEPGSVKLLVELPTEAAQRLVMAWEKNRLQLRRFFQPANLQRRATSKGQGRSVRKRRSRLEELGMMSGRRRIRRKQETGRRSERTAAPTDQVEEAAEAAEAPTLLHRSEAEEA